MTYRILVVDDDPDLREVIADALSLDGHAVDIANDGHHALQLLQYQSYDLIVSDLRMPHLDGRELYRRLLQRYGHNIPPVIFLTGAVQDDDYADFLAGIGEPVLRKPFHRWQLRDLIAQELEPKK